MARAAMPGCVIRITKFGAVPGAEHLETACASDVGMCGQPVAKVRGNSMPKHSELDFPHAAAWCDDCWADSHRIAEHRLGLDTLGEMRRHNDLLEELLEQGGAYQRKPYRPYTPPLPLPPPTQPSRSGGLNVKPRST